MGIRAFIDSFREQRDGALLDELTPQWNELIRQVRKTDKGGSMTITIRVVPHDGDATQVFIYDDVKITFPKIKKPASLFFTTPESNVQKRNPRQPDLSGIDSPHLEVDNEDNQEVNS